MIKGLRKFQQLPMLLSRDTARAPKCSASETTPCRYLQGVFDPNKTNFVCGEVFFRCSINQKLPKAHNSKKANRVTPFVSGISALRELLDKTMSNHEKKWKKRRKAGNTQKLRRQWKRRTAAGAGGFSTRGVKNRSFSRKRTRGSDL